MLIKQNTKSTNRPTGVNVLVAVAMSAGLAFSAIPANAYIPKSSKVEIKINAVDLESDRGIQRVYSYLTDQAEQACESPGRSSIATRQFEKTCTEGLLSSFIEDVNDERLTNYHKIQLAG